ncbi:hypothetical protein KUTeg_002349 [Tegillarca granosa]|uniref:peptidylprolyl isomerase n=1 Tax=Tegillarca granosa TaxID=220873 RepID=A0ABQ9FVD7_TEGGR|nr:hypothetical protein KUTeg_002349 [Tegillarca granosa]
MKRMLRFLILSVFISIILFVSTYANEEEDNNKSELKISVLEPGASCERTAKFNDIVKIHVEGFLQDGQKIESSYERGKPLFFQLGFGQVVKGLEDGVYDMCVGEKRKLIIPPHLGIREPG